MVRYFFLEILRMLCLRYIKLGTFVLPEEQMTQLIWRSRIKLIWTWEDIVRSISMKKILSMKPFDC